MNRAFVFLVLSTATLLLLTPQIAGAAANDTMTDDGISIFECGDTVLDIDGNIYNTVQIGTRCLMKENLQRGTRIAIASSQTNNATVEKYCYGDSDANCATHGGLYQWGEAMSYAAGCNGTGSSQPACSTPVQGICPDGWHIPSHYEWTLLERSLLGSTVFPYDTTTTGWLGTTEGTMFKSGGSSGFDGLLAQNPNTSDSFNDRDAIAYFWSSSVDGSLAWGRFLHSSHATVYRDSHNQAQALSVRCLKD